MLSQAGAQVQERKLEERLTRPDMTLSNAAQNKSFDAAKSFENSTGNRVLTKEFFFTRWFRPKEFQTKEFNSKSYAAADRKLPVSDARTKAETRDAVKRYETKAAPVNDARESNKSFATSEYASAREFRGKGKSQKLLDQEYANREPMSIDQVRELLNKNK